MNVMMSWDSNDGFDARAYIKIKANVMQDNALLFAPSREAEDLFLAASSSEHWPS